MKSTVKPQLLKGFRDFFAEDVQIREYVINAFKRVFEKYGYEPLETPALEYADIFERESGEEASKLFYKFKDEGGREIMLKYEVMIAMCRAVAVNINTIIFPYKRYQIQSVWRAEKPQKGRYREFTQCDADTIGSKSVLCDAEFIQMGIEVLKNLGFEKFRAIISNRKLLNGIIKLSGASDEQFIPICLSIDKLPKIGKEKVKEELLNKRKISEAVADKILAIVTRTGDSEKLLQDFSEQLSKSPTAVEGLNELKDIFNYLKTAEIEPDTYLFSPYIARGLAYYTGPIWEFEIVDGSVGSVAGCGRYDNTIGRFIGRETPATGGSFGIDRLIEIIKDRKMFKSSKTPIKALVTLFNKELLKESLSLANLLRRNEISAMLYPESIKIDKQLKYADRKNIPFVIIIGPEEVKKNLLKLKNMKTGEQFELNQNDLILKLKNS
ncbi:MAG: Histidyl-tRNA synthetase [Candidatus Roizmanbacteria bacterium GW2011_GWA2_36_23]|uniref:Histidine--tRNA ligase n=1 Tax=Candidatus Roizmanbacteria bacterium GW2011_GWA2_36_23 TaxID=1618480 RepID=A0A0G0HCY2_9BACT|nr:MAG: Histidyl-tRNA synthetase [Candidatus Roizmanbacteria bacterium GW2011_GWA2_36_23]